MNKELQARRAKAEAVFNDLQTFQQNTLAKLKEFGLTNFDEVGAELARLQGEYRVIDELLNKVAKPSKVSPKAEVIDVDAATEENTNV